VGIGSLSQLFLVSCCGHTACQACLQARVDTEACIHEGCGVSIQPDDMIRASDLGSAENDTSASPGSYGRKLDEVSALIKQLPESDQSIVFAPNDEIGRVLEDFLNDNNVSFHSLVTRKTGVARTLEDFKTNTNPREKKKVLILNLASESAAGA
jgi:hypothetical protein